jgi:hypothetical protein
VKREWDFLMMNQSADGQSAVAAFCADQGTLRIKGVLVATVVDVLEFPPLFVDMNESKNNNIAEQPLCTPPIVALVKEIAEKLDLSETAHYGPLRGSTILEALCYVLVISSTPAGSARCSLQGKATSGQDPQLHNLGTRSLYCWGECGPWSCGRKRGWGILPPPAAILDMVVMLICTPSSGPAMHMA